MSRLPRHDIHCSNTSFCVADTSGAGAIPKRKKTMKLIFVPLLSTILLLAGCGESGTPQERAESALQRLTEACANQQGDNSGAEGLVLYTGSDRDRKYKEFASAEGEERAQLNSACYRINRLMKGGDGYTVASYETEDESEGSWHVLQVNFDSGEEAVFAFLEVDGQMGLGDID